jgi:hypothetical protein
MRWILVAFTYAGVAHAQPVPSVGVSGMVAHPGPVMLDKLNPVTVSAKFGTMHGEVSHSWSGPLLADVIGAAGVTDAPGKKTHWRHVIIAEGADHYGVAVAIGEIDPRGAGKQVIVAVKQDAKVLPAPRLIVPGDASFARGVHDLVTLEVR